MPGINLRKPYKGYRGYKQILPNGRRYVHMWHPKSGKRKFMSLARYRLAVKLGRRLKKGEDADHIDEDGTNDSYDNLQLLSHTDNVHKHVMKSGKTAVAMKYLCANCGEDFERPKRGKIYRFCSRKCIGLFGFNKK